MATLIPIDHLKTWLVDHNFVMDRLKLVDDVSIVFNDHFRAKGNVNGFKDVEVALGYGASCFFVGSDSKYEFNAFLDHFGGFKVGVCAHNFGRVAVVVTVHGCIMPLGGIDRILV
jgi:hypothetical protein